MDMLWLNLGGTVINGAFMTMNIACKGPRWLVALNAFAFGIGAFATVSALAG